MLYIMRHGQTDWNLQHKLQGKTDIPLNEAGRAMAENARQKYRDIHLDICYCSPLRRARETAEILLRGRDVPILSDDRLAEMDFGRCEGVKYGPLFPDSPIAAAFSTPDKYVADNGAETFESLFARTGEFLREVADPLLMQGKDVLIVGHVTMNCSIIGQLRGIPLKDFWSVKTDNCELVRLL